MKALRRNSSVVSAEEGANDLDQFDFAVDNQNSEIKWQNLDEDEAENLVMASRFFRFNTSREIKQNQNNSRLSMDIRLSGPSLDNTDITVQRAMVNTSVLSQSLISNGSVSVKDSTQFEMRSKSSSMHY